jgi:tetratricopeptide (TPR) repeat protein
MRYRALPLLVFPLWALACASPARYVVQPDALVEGYQKSHSDDSLPTIDVPYWANEELRSFADEVTRGKRGERRLAIAVGAAIVSQVGGEGLSYESFENFTAVEAFDAGHGNCLSFTNLFVALARAAGLPAVYVLVDHIDDFAGDEQRVVAMRHMCAGFYREGKLHLVDFGNIDPATYWNVRAIDDREAVAFFYANLGYAAYDDGDLDGALTLYRTALDLEPGFSPGWNNLGTALRRAGDLDAAEQAFASAIRADPQSVAALSNLAALHRDQDREEDAAAAEKRIERIRSRSPYHLFVRARLARERGAPAEAVNHLRRALSHGRNIPLLHLELAAAYRDLGQMDRALAAYRRAFRMDPGSADAERAIDELDDLKLPGETASGIQ